MDVDVMRSSIEVELLGSEIEVPTDNASTSVCVDGFVDGAIPGGHEPPDLEEV